MASFWKIETPDYFDIACKLQECIPQLKKCNPNDLVDDLRGSRLSFIRKVQKPTPVWIRLTLPFGIILIFLAFLSLPFKFMLTGSWTYKSIKLSNYFTALGF